VLAAGLSIAGQTVYSRNQRPRGAEWKNDGRQDFRTAALDTRWPDPAPPKYLNALITRFFLVYFHGGFSPARNLHCCRPDCDRLRFIASITTRKAGGLSNLQQHPVLGKKQPWGAGSGSFVNPPPAAPVRK